MDIRLSKVQGCLMGVLLGDAIGMPWEIYTHEEIMEATDGKGVTGFQEAPVRCFPQMRGLVIGSTTDDWQLTKALAECIIKTHTYSRYYSAESLAAEYQKTTAGWGRTTRNSAAEIDEYFSTKGKSGRDPLLPLSPPKSGKGCGNGVAMRIAPLAIYSTLRDTGLFYCKGEYLSHFVREEGSLTHPDSRAIEAAFAIAYLIHHLFTFPLSMHYGDEKFDLDRKILLHILLMSLRSERRQDFHAHEAGELLDKLEWMKNHLDLADNPNKLREKIGTSCFALESIPFAIGTFLRHPCDFRAGVFEAIDAGGDTDTNASMVGAMIGANVGIEGIPQEWIEFRLEYQEALKIGKQLFEVCKTL